MAQPVDVADIPTHEGPGHLDGERPWWSPALAVRATGLGGSVSVLSPLCLEASASTLFLYGSSGWRAGLGTTVSRKDDRSLFFSLLAGHRTAYLWTLGPFADRGAAWTLSADVDWLDPWDRHPWLALDAHVGLGAARYDWYEVTEHGDIKESHETWPELALGLGVAFR